MKRVVTLFLLFVFVSAVKSQNYKFQALFMYNIAQRIEWPNISGNFIIGVVGCKDIQKELSEIAAKRQLFGNKMQVINLTVDKLKQSECQIVYVGKTSSNKLEEVTSNIQSKHTLLITNKEGLVGSGINFIDNSKKIEFEIYPSIIKKHQLNLSNSLLSLGIVKE